MMAERQDKKHGSVERWELSEWNSTWAESVKLCGQTREGLNLFLLQWLGMVLKPSKSLSSKLETKSADNFGSIHQNIFWDIRARMDWNTPSETLLCGFTIIPTWMTTTVFHGWVQVQVYFWLHMLRWRLLFGFERFWKACSEEEGCVADNYCNVFSSYWCNLTGWIIFNGAGCTH